jgi:hypothetical protein
MSRLLTVRSSRHVGEKFVTVPVQASILAGAFQRNGADPSLIGVDLRRPKNTLRQFGSLRGASGAGVGGHLRGGGHNASLGGNPPLA